MQAPSGRLFLGFWSLSLENLPIGSIQHRLIDTATAEQLIRAARDGGMLRCGSSVDLVAPYKAREARRHAQLCTALSSRLHIPITQDEFLVSGEDGLTSIFPLRIVQLGASDRLLIVDCNYRIRAEHTAKFEDRFEVAEDSIRFHLFEPEATGFRPSDILASADADDGARTEEVPAVDLAVVAVHDAITSGDQLRAITENADGDGLVSVEEVDTLEYPCIASAFLDYYATGEGRTIGVIVMQADDGEAIRAAVRDEWDPYFEVDVRIRPWRGLPAGFDALDPGPALALLDEQFASRPSFRYSATLHFNGA